MSEPYYNVLDDVVGNNDSYYVGIGHGKVWAAGKNLVGAVEWPCNLLEKDDPNIFEQLAHPLFDGSVYTPTNFTGHHGALTDSGKTKAGDDGAEPHRKYGAEVDGSLKASSASVGAAKISIADTLVFNKVNSSPTIPNFYLGKPYGAEEKHKQYKVKLSMKHTSTNPAYSANINEGGELISAQGAMNLTVKLAKGAKLEVNGMVEFNPATSWSAGEPSEDKPHCEAWYNKEHVICKDRADLAKIAEESRYSRCMASAGSEEEWSQYSSYDEEPCDAFDPDEHYDDCLKSCKEGTDEGTASCYDENYSSIGGRPPDQWHDCNCGEGSDCNFKVLMNFF